MNKNSIHAMNFFVNDTERMGFRSLLFINEINYDCLEKKTHFIQKSIRWLTTYGLSAANI